MRALARAAALFFLIASLASPVTAACPEVAPTLEGPTNGSTVTFGNVTFEWSAVANAAGYELFGGLDGDPLASIGLTTATSKSLTIEPGRTVQWRVAARAAGCDDKLSAISSFITSCPTSGPALQIPPNNDSIMANHSITFAWFAVPGAASYDLRVSPDAGETWDVVVENHTATSFATSFGEGSYLWEVRANFDGDCEPLYSNRRQFTAGPDCAGNAAPEPQSPANNATNVASPVTFKWRGSPGAASYRLFAAVDGGTPALLATTTDTEVTREISGSRVTWTVQAVFSGDCTTMSDISRFSLADHACPANPGKAALSSPAAGATNLSSPVTFRWNAVPNARGYRVLVAFGTDAQPESLGETTDTQLTAPVPAGSGFWIVQTFFGDECPSTLSDRRSFTVTTGAPCEDVVPQTISPANGATGIESPVEFRWSAISGATAYRLFVATGEEDFAFYGETAETSLQRLVPAGTVRWFVLARRGACPDVRSAAATFTVVESVRECDAATITLLSPSDASTQTSPVRVAWTAVAGATTYRVWASLDGAAPVNLARTSATEATLNLPAGEIEWYVEALRPQCDSVVSARGRFEVTEAANCASRLAPVLVSPVGSEPSPAQATSPVTLTWQAVDGALAYRVWVARRGQPFEDIALTRETSTTTEVEPGLHRWFVQALFDGCSPMESAVAFFNVPGEQRCSTSVPLLLSPVQGSTATSPVTFTWTETGAEKYRLFASINDQDPVLLGTTAKTSLSRALPPGLVAWGVEAVTDECPSRRSERGTFTIARSQNCTDEGAQLVTPANASSLSSSAVDFAWNAVSGAVRYVLVIRANGGAPTAVESTTETQVSQTVPAGTIEWWVVTFFAGCEPAESDHFRFDVARPAACENPRPLLLHPSERRDVFSPVRFAWSDVPNATGYRVWARQEEGSPVIIATSTEPQALVELPEGIYDWFVEATFEGCDSRRSARSEMRVAPPVACGTPRKPLAQVIGQALSGTSYRLRWTALPNVGLYEVQESRSLDFANAETFTTSDVSMTFVHENDDAPVQYLYRVRGVSDCNDSRGPFSDIVGVFVIAPRTNNASAEIGAGESLVQEVFLAGSTSPVGFTVTTDKPWVTVTPSSGTLPPEGLTLRVTADPEVLALGTNTTSLRVQYETSGKGSPQADGTTTLNIPVSVSIVTPVLPVGKGTPPPDALIFPVVGHAAGANNSLFESDIRVTNLSAQTMRYQLNFTPSGLDGTQNGTSTTIEIAPNATVAVDDVVATLFGTLSSSTGTLEVRPLTPSSSAAGLLAGTPAEGLLRDLVTAASSRTYNFTPSGTFGQFIPAVPFSEFVGRALPGELAAVLSLQQVEQNSAYRSNFGFAEGSGNPVSLAVRVYDTAGTLLRTIPVSLQAGEHRQINGMLSANGITDLADGRVEVEVLDGDGKVTAYVSQVDNKTNDPLLVSPVLKGAVSSTRYVIPGMAFLTSSAFWVSDLRIFNAGDSATPATVTFYAQGRPHEPVSREITLEAGEIEVLDNVIGDFLGQPNGAGGSIVVSTPAASRLTASARTYNSTANGTYGQFIPGVTPEQSVGREDRALQILQLEQSSRFRTNIGLAETSGNPATVHVSAHVPDSIVTPVVEFVLAANEFRQFSLAQFGLGSVYNARVTVKVVSGDGRVTAYGSAIDSITQDPTYVPAQ